MNSHNVAMYSLIDPYVYQTLSANTGASLVVQTTHGSLRGTLQTVMPDHIILEVSGSPFYVRIQQIVWISPSEG